MASPGTLTDADIQRMTAGGKTLTDEDIRTAESKPTAAPPPEQPGFWKRFGQTINPLNLLGAYGSALSGNPASFIDMGQRAAAQALSEGANPVQAALAPIPIANDVSRGNFRGALGQLAGGAVVGRAMGGPEIERVAPIARATGAGVRAAAPGLAKGAGMVASGELLGKVPGMEWPARFGLGYPGVRAGLAGLRTGLGAFREAMKSGAPEAAGEVSAESLATADGKVFSKLSKDEQTAYQHIAQGMKNYTQQTGAPSNVAPIRPPGAQPAPEPAPESAGPITPELRARMPGLPLRTRAAAEAPPAAEPILPRPGAGLAQPERILPGKPTGAARLGLTQRIPFQPPAAAEPPAGAARPIAAPMRTGGAMLPRVSVSPASETAQSSGNTGISPVGAVPGLGNRVTVPSSATSEPLVPGGAIGTSNSTVRETLQNPSAQGTTPPTPEEMAAPFKSESPRSPYTAAGERKSSAMRGEEIKSFHQDVRAEKLADHIKTNNLDPDMIDWNQIGAKIGVKDPSPETIGRALDLLGRKKK